MGVGGGGSGHGGGGGIWGGGGVDRPLPSRGISLGRGISRNRQPAFGHCFVFLNGRF